MKRISSPLILGTLLIASAATLFSCRQQNTATSEKQSETSIKTEVVTETNTEATAEKAAAEAALKEGEDLYMKNCQSCHALAPPAKSAPPIIALAAQYRSMYGKKKNAVADMVSFMKEPAVGKSILGSKTFERFGLMPALSMPDEELEKVAGWLWDQYDPNFEGGGDCQ